MNVLRGLCYPKLTPYSEVNYSQWYRKFYLLIFIDIATQMLYLKYPKGILGKLKTLPNKFPSTPKVEDDLELVYQEEGMPNMNIDEVITAMLVHKTTPRHEVDEHDEDGGPHMDGKHGDDEHVEDEQGK